MVPALPVIFKLIVSSFGIFPFIIRGSSLVKQVVGSAENLNLHTKNKAK